MDLVGLWVIEGEGFLIWVELGFDDLSPWIPSGVIRVEEKERERSGDDWWGVLGEEEERLGTDAVKRNAGG